MKLNIDAAGDYLLFFIGGIRYTQMIIAIFMNDLDFFKLQEKIQHGEDTGYERDGYGNADDDQPGFLFTPTNIGGQGTSSFSSFHPSYVSAAKGMYATYSKHNIVFGFNKGSQIFDVRSYDNSLKQVTMSKVKEVLGIPENTYHFDTEDMLVYKAGEKYQLLFIFPKANQQNSNPQLNHYNVFYPRGTVNLMADDPGIKY